LYLKREENSGKKKGHPPSSFRKRSILSRGWKRPVSGFRRIAFPEYIVTINIGAYGTLGRPRKSISSSVAESLPQTLKKGG
jgi:hypothetical protein